MSKEVEELTVAVDRITKAVSDGVGEIKALVGEIKSASSSGDNNTVHALANRLNEAAGVMEVALQGVVVPNSPSEGS